MSDNPKGKDGAARNDAKMKREFKKLRREMKPHWREFRRRPFNGHSWVNLWVESARISPYFMGHIHALEYPAIAGAIIYLW